VLATVAAGGTRLIALRSAGFNHVDLAAAAALGLTVSRVPAYSPYAVAEHAVALILTLNRKVHRAYWRVREANFALTGLLGFDLRGRTVGVIGTGTIGRVFARIMLRFGCRVVAFDPYPHDEAVALGATYTDLPTLFAESDITALPRPFAASDVLVRHCPLAPATHRLIDAEALSQMKRGVMLVNTSRGALIDTAAVIGALKDGIVGYPGLDVYEEEEELFFEDQ